MNILEFRINRFTYCFKSLQQYLDAIGTHIIFEETGKFFFLYEMASTKIRGWYPSFPARMYKVTILCEAMLCLGGTA